MNTIEIDGVLIPTEKLIAAGWKAPEVKKFGRWKPKKWERYWTINIYKPDEAIQMVWEDKETDKAYWFMGLVFRTEGEAETYVKRQKAIVRVNDRIDAFNGEWIPDWKNPNQSKYLIGRNYGINYGTYSTYDINDVKYTDIIVCSKSKEISEMIIKEMKGDLDTIFQEQK